ncbi:MAG: hypothetical protein AMS27_08600 [Bacteroides sp. SM23_62_1]|nr:MAG: hypothetical protein AMS27_08600 [Bacteroides sp. SM23_62_1]
MKKYLYYLGLSVTVLALGICMNLVTSCEGPEGPAGMDANENCVQCHNDGSVLFAKSLQAGNSKHMTGTAFERNSTSCAICHTSQGFVERMDAGTTTTSGTIHNPTPPNCRTCHMIHENYDTTDFALRYSDPVTLWINDVTIDLGDGNLCANCHQPRIPDPLPTVGGGNVTINSNRWGPHHGLQSSTLWGTGGYEIAGSESYGTPGSTTHAGAGCTQCHMAEAYGNQAGGHTFNMTYDYHGRESENVAACTGCHSSLKSFDYNGVQSEVEELLDSLKNVLADKGWLDPDEELPNASSDNPLVLSADDAGTLLNFLIILEDGSHGVHNPGYTVALLTNSLEHLTK